MSQVSLRMRLTTVIALFCFCAMTMTAATGAMAQTKGKANTGSHTANAYVQWTDGQGNTFSGVLNISSFSPSPDGKSLIAQGMLNGTVTTAANQTQAVSQSVSLPVTSIDPSCGILDLVLGPLNLSVLGLNISLNQVVLVITATPGAGNLLGNLLCDVANLLNPGGSLSGLITQLTTLLNQILAAL